MVGFDDAPAESRTTAGDAASRRIEHPRVRRRRGRRRPPAPPRTRTPARRRTVGAPSAARRRSAIVLVVRAGHRLRGRPVRRSSTSTRCRCAARRTSRRRRCSTPPACTTATPWSGSTPEPRSPGIERAALRARRDASRREWPGHRAHHGARAQPVGVGRRPGRRSRWSTAPGGCSRRSTRAPPGDAAAARARRSCPRREARSTPSAPRASPVRSPGLAAVGTSRSSTPSQGIVLHLGRPGPRSGWGMPPRSRRKVGAALAVLALARVRRQAGRRTST